MLSAKCTQPPKIETTTNSLYGTRPRFCVARHRLLCPARATPILSPVEAGLTSILRGESMRSAAIVLVVLAFTLSCLAQDNSTRAIHGTVFYPSIRRIADANVALVNSATGFRYEQFTNSQGQFAIELLPRANTPRVKPPGIPSQPDQPICPAGFSAISESLGQLRSPWQLPAPFRRTCCRSPAGAFSASRTISHSGSSPGQHLGGTRSRKPRHRRSFLFVRSWPETDSRP